MHHGLVHEAVSPQRWHLDVSKNRLLEGQVIRTRPSNSSRPVAGLSSDLHWDQDADLT